MIEATLPDKISLDTSPEQRLWSSLTLSPLQMLLVANVSMPSSRPILRRAAGGGGVLRVPTNVFGIPLL